MNSEVSLLIKTFERPHKLDRLLQSISDTSSANVPILIADDSKDTNQSTWFERDNVSYFKLPYDRGLSYGRNFLVDKAETPFCVVLDDDFFFTPDTKLHVLLDIVKNKGFDLAAGAVQGLIHGAPGYGNIEIKGKNLQLLMGAPPREIINDLPVYDVVNNFFLAKTETLKEEPWDNRFKIYGEHTDFFCRYSRKYKVTFTDKVMIGHESGGYLTLRGYLGKHGSARGYRSARILGKKYGIERFGGARIFGVRKVLSSYLRALKILLLHGTKFLVERLRSS